MSDRPALFKYQVGDVIRIGVYKHGHLSHEVHGLIEARLFKYFHRIGRVPCYKIYSDDEFYCEGDILGLVPLDCINPR